MDVGLLLTPLIPLVLFYSFFCPSFGGYASGHSCGTCLIQFWSRLANSTHERVFESQLHGQGCHPLTPSFRTIFFITFRADQTGWYERPGIRFFHVQRGRRQVPSGSGGWTPLPWSIILSKESLKDSVEGNISSLH